MTLQEFENIYDDVVEMCEEVAKERGINIKKVEFDIFVDEKGCMMIKVRKNEA